MENNFLTQFRFIRIGKDTRSKLCSVGTKLEDLCNFMIETIVKTSFGICHIANSLEEATFDSVMREEKIIELLRIRLKEGHFIDLLIKLNEDMSRCGQKIVTYYCHNGSTFLITKETKDTVIRSLEKLKDKNL